MTEVYLNDYILEKIWILAIFIVMDRVADINV